MATLNLPPSASPMLRLPYGRGSCEAFPPGPVEWVFLEPGFPPAGDPEELLERALANPVGSAPLRDRAHGARSAAILVPGKDRVAGAERYLPRIIEALLAAGLPAGRIEIVLATGTHITHTEDEIVALLGAASASKVRWRQHDCRPGNHFVALGRTRLGTRVEMDRAVVEADLKILTGRVLPHYFAGFSGGRKALLPGVSSRPSILANHRLTLSGTAGIHPAAAPGSLTGNPVHEDMVDAAGRVEGTFVLNTLLDPGHRLVAAVAGDLEQAHARGCELAAQWHAVPLEQPLDGLVTSAGGWPYDCDFVQSLKALFNVQSVLKPGARILWLAQCAQGMKEGFLRWAGIASDEELEIAVRRDYDLAGHNTIMLRALQRRANIALLSELPESSVRALGIHPVPTLAQGLAWLAEGQAGPRRVGVLAHGNILYSFLRSPRP